MAKCMQCGGMKKATKMKKMKVGGMKTTVGSKDAKTFVAGIPNTGPTGPNYQGIDTAQKGGSMKKYAKGGATDSRYNRASSPGCKGGYVKDANGKCVPERTAKVGGTMKKAAGGPILDKLKAKLAERKVTKAIKKSVKSSGKIIKS